MTDNFQYEDVKDVKHKYPKAPLPVLEAIHRYATKGYLPGSFTTAVLENDLRHAMVLADKNSKAGIDDIIKYCLYEIPGPCWGSPDKVERWWLSKRREDELAYGSTR